MDVSTSQQFIDVYNRISKLETDITNVVKEFYSNLVKSYDEIVDTPENLSDFNNDLDFITKDEVEDRINNISIDDSGYLKKTGEEKQKCTAPTEFEELYTTTQDPEDSSDKVATTKFVHSLVSNNRESVTQQIIGAVGKKYITSKAAESIIKDKIGEHQYGNVVNLVNKKIEDAIKGIEDMIPEVDVPTRTSDLVNDSGFITLGDVPGDLVTSVNGQTGNVQITIPQVPTNISSFTNDVGYITDPGVTSVNNRTGNVMVQENVQSDWSATTGLAKILNKPTIPTTYAGSTTAGGPANKAVSIPYAEVDSTSTSTVFTATVAGITELVDGVCVYLKNGVVGSASGWTLNVNNLGAKPVYITSANSSRSTTQFSSAYTYLFIYNSTRIEDGCWDMYQGVSTVTAAAQLIGNNTNSVLPTLQKFYRYRLLFTSVDGTHYIPANTSTSTNATAARAVNQIPINPFGAIIYYSATTAINAEANFSHSYAYTCASVTLGYSFNRTGAALTLTAKSPVYIKCAPQSDGSAIIDADNPYVQTLPSTDDGKIYIYLGNAFSATAVQLVPNHPVYYYKDGAIRRWTGAEQRIAALEQRIAALEDLLNNS